MNYEIEFLETVAEFFQEYANSLKIPIEELLANVFFLQIEKTKQEAQNLSLLTKNE